jgi:hypothetical protein
MLDWIPLLTSNWNLEWTMTPRVDTEMDMEWSLLLTSPLDLFQVLSIEPTGTSLRTLPTQSRFQFNV